MKTQFDPVLMINTLHKSIRALNKEARALEHLLSYYSPEEVENTLPSALKAYIESDELSSNLRQKAAQFLKKIKKNFLKKLPRKILLSQSLEKRIEEEKLKRQKIDEVPPTQRYSCSCGKNYSTENGLYNHQKKSKDPQCKLRSESESQQPQKLKKSKKIKKTKPKATKPKYSQSD